MPGNKSLPPGYLRIEEAAERLGVKTPTLRKWRQHQYGPRSTRINTLVAYRPEWLADWLAECESSNGAPSATAAAERQPRPSIRIPAQPRRRSAA